MRCPKAFASLMALTLALSLGLTACMGSPREAGSAPVSEGVAQEKTAGRVGQGTDEEEVDPENVDPDEVIADEARQWSDAWMGELGTGERCLYARSPDGSEATEGPEERSHDDERQKRPARRPRAEAD